MKKLKYLKLKPKDVRGNYRVDFKKALGFARLGEFLRKLNV